MSYTNPTEPQYVPTSGAVNRMQQSLVKAAITQIDAKKEKEEEAIADKKVDMQNTIAYGKMLGEEINGTPIEGVLDLTYKGSNKEYASLKRMMDDGKCVSENCEVEAKQLQFMEDGPKQSLELLSDVQANIDILKSDNVDPKHPLYQKLQTAGRVIGKENLYGTKQNYGIKVNRLKDAEGNLTGQQEIIFTGEEFGEDGWKINSATLNNLMTGDNPIGLINETPSFADQSNATTKASGILEGSKNPQNAKVYGKNPGLDLSFAQQMSTDVPPKPVKGIFNTEIKELEWHNEKTGKSGTYTARVYVFDENKIKAQLEPEISATVDTMFDPKAGGPNDAISLFNQTFTNKNSGSFAVTEKEIKKYSWIGDDGKMDYLAADLKVNPKGTDGSIYEKDGKLKSDVKELYQEIYMDHYMRETVLPKMEDIEVPGTAIESTGPSIKDIRKREFELSEQKEAARLAEDEKKNKNKPKIGE